MDVPFPRNRPNTPTVHRLLPSSAGVRELHGPATKADGQCPPHRARYQHREHRVHRQHRDAHLDHGAEYLVLRRLEGRSAWPREAVSDGTRPVWHPGQLALARLYDDGYDAWSAG